MKKEKVLCAGIIGLTTLLLLLLCVSENLWYDEAYSVALIKHPVRELIAITAKDVHTPFYYLLLKGFFHVCGDHIQGAKVFSVVFLVLFQVLTAVEVRRIWGGRAAVYSLLLILALPSVMVHGADVRMYTMGLFCLGLTCAWAYRAFETMKKGWWVGFTVACIATMYVHIFTMLACFCLFLILFAAAALKRDRGRFPALCVSGGVAALAYVPWLMVVLKQFSKIQKDSQYGEVTDQSFTGYLIQWFSSDWKPGFRTIQAWCVVLVLAVVFFFLTKYWKGAGEIAHRRVAFILLLLPALPTLFGILFSRYVENIYMGRYSFPLLGLLCIFLGVVMASARKQWPVWIMLAVLVLAGMKNYGTEYTRQRHQGMENFATFVSENVGDKDVFVVDAIHESLFLLYEEGHPFYCVGPKREMDPFDTRSFVDWEDLGDAEKIYLISFHEDPLSLAFFEDYPNRLAKEFDYMMYHVKIYEVDYEK